MSFMESHLPRSDTHSVCLGYIAEIHWLVEALTKKQERLHIAIATGVLCVKLERDSITQSRTIEDCPVVCSVWNTCKNILRRNKDKTYRHGKEFSFSFKDLPHLQSSEIHRVVGDNSDKVILQSELMTPVANWSEHTKWDLHWVSVFNT